MGRCAMQECMHAICTETAGISAWSIFSARPAVSAQSTGNENTLACKRVRAGLCNLGDIASGLICFAAQFFKLSDVARNRGRVDL